MKLLVVSTAKNTNRILEQMKAQAGDQLEVVLHLGDKTAQYKASSLSRMKPTNGTEGHLMDGRQYSGKARDLITSPSFFRHRDVLADHLNRTAESYKHKSHPLNSQQDFHDYYHILADTLADEIIKSGATHCLFFNVPHLAYDTMVYQVAKSIGLPIKIVTQSLFPNRFFSMSDPADYGEMRQDDNAVPYAIEKGSKPDLFYMKGIKQEREEGGRISGKAYLQLATFLLLKRPMSALNPWYLTKTLRHMKKTYGSLPKWRDPFARFFHEDEFAYFDHLASYEDQDVDLSGDFVYFPLQLQPEMTTSSLGGLFRDQAYAIERLSEMLPEGVRILVKENPKQGAYMRGPLFFHRLKRIPSVTFLPSWANTHALTAGAKFVAAVTGTVGWEAIRAGTPALVFGKAWYRKLPGVFEFSEAPTYDDIANSSVDHDSLQHAVGALMTSAHEGVVDRYYAKMVEGFDSDHNDQSVATQILSLLNDTSQTSFLPVSENLA